jgi:hypothetical protein
MMLEMLLLPLAACTVACLSTKPPRLCARNTRGFDDARFQPPDLPNSEIAMQLWTIRMSFWRWRRCTLSLNIVDNVFCRLHVVEGRHAFEVGVEDHDTEALR